MNQKTRSIITGTMGLFLAVSLGWAVAAADKETRYINLSVGSFHDEKVPEAPADFTPGGTFRKVTKVEYNAEEKILRFSPQAVGVGTLIITDKSGKVVYEFTVDVRKTD